MEFSTKTIGNNTKYYINNSEVSEKTYFSMWEEENEKGCYNSEDECSDREFCPRCSMIKEMANDIYSAEDETEAFEILHSIIDMIEECAFNDGYKSALSNSINNMTRIIKEIEESEEE
jgi:hypothetical protein